MNSPFPCLLKPRHSLIIPCLFNLIRNNLQRKRFEHSSGRYRRSTAPDTSWNWQKQTNHFPNDIYAPLTAKDARKNTFLTVFASCVPNIFNLWEFIFMFDWFEFQSLFYYRFLSSFCRFSCTVFLFDPQLLQFCSWSSIIYRNAFRQFCHRVWISNHLIDSIRSDTRFVETTARAVQRSEMNRKARHSTEVSTGMVYMTYILDFVIGIALLWLHLLVFW